ncbi:hypothetical protein B0H67DRAFT_585567 [Lasiosphaeris hirsuta]|uniref:J domain-containing protein n=1 Tax=Lasiosphaeris hirsuta TaxID=260670 RepID=A0AA40DTQ1_9PEZI|nr:hypothetical protein B0H67DRAFT_585567 [Lasiosphaeris hirsuta]
MDTDLVAYARDAAAKGDDLFLLLSTDATASESDVRRAFKRKALTAHPDKAGDAYDPALYERLERARDVLCNPAAREAYNSGMSAIRQKKLQLDQMSERRRKLVEDLERREQAAKRAKMGKGQDQVQRDPEREAMAARGRAKMEERQRLMREAEERESRAQRGKDDDERQKEQHAEPKARKKRDSTPKSQPTSPRPGGSFADDGGEGLDAREAWLERRIKEKAERRAERAKKKAIKSGVPLAPGSEAQNQGATPPPSSTGAAKTDADKLPPTTAPGSTAPSFTADPAANPSARLSSTMARLKAAQAKRDEEKRKREAEALANSVEA